MNPENISYPDDVDWRQLLPEFMQSNEFWTDLTDTINYVLNRNIKGPTDQLLNLRQYNVEPYYAGLTAQMMGFKLPTFQLTTDQYQLLLQNLGKFYQTRGSSTQFVNFLNYILNIDLTYYPLWTNSLTAPPANYTTSPQGATIDQGGTWFATNYYDITYDNSTYNLTPEQGILLVESIAPIHIVLRQFASISKTNINLTIQAVPIITKHVYTAVGS